MGYFLKPSFSDVWCLVTKEEFMEAEKRAGFRSKFEGEPATAGFSGNGIEGKVIEENE